MTAAQTAYMLVKLGHDDDNVTEALVLEYQAITYDEARQLVAEAHRAKAAIDAKDNGRDGRAGQGG